MNESNASPRHNQTIKARLLRMLKLIAILYLLYALLASIFQEALIFPGRGRQFSGRTPGNVEVWKHPVEQGEVVAWFIPGRGRTASSPGPAVMHFHGNYELIDEAFVTPTYTQLGISVLLIEYRGYGNADGKPTADAILKDAIAFRNTLAARPEVDESRLIYHGRSLGSGFACELARHEPPAALVLETPFTSLASFAHRMGLPGVLLRHRLSPNDVVPALDCPIFIIHGTNDEVIPVKHSRKLAALAKHATYYETTDSHNDLPSDLSAYERTLRAFLEDAGFVPPR